LPAHLDIIRLICRLRSSSPRPKSSTPALLDTTVSPLTSGRERSAAMSVSGMPHRPNPPTSTVAPAGMSATAAAALATSLPAPAAA
jgi:hypothetical protein